MTDRPSTFATVAGLESWLEAQLPPDRRASFWADYARLATTHGAVLIDLDTLTVVGAPGWERVNLVFVTRAPARLGK